MCGWMGVRACMGVDVRDGEERECDLVMCIAQGPVRGEGVKGEGESGTSPPCEVEYRLVILEQLVEEALTMVSSG